MSEQALDLNGVLSTIRRHRAVVVAAALIGTAFGVLLVLAKPPMYSSSTLVLLAPQQNWSGQPVPRDMSTESRIVMSDAVLGKARTLVEPVLSRDRIAQLVTASSPSQQMLQIVAQGRTSRAAESLAQAVATSEVSYQQLASSSLSAAERQVLDSRESNLKKQLATVNKEIEHAKQLLSNNRPDSPQARAGQAALGQLTAQQSTLVLDIDGVRSQRSAHQSGPGATIVQDATPAKRPRLVVWLILSALMFTVIGAGIAVAVVVGLARRDRRLRTRDEIADALGSPVIGSVKSHRARGTAGWSLLLEGYRPGPVDAWSLRQVLDRIGAGPLLSAAPEPGAATRPNQMRVVIALMADDSGALAVAAQLAAHTASLGLSTRLTTRQRHGFADPLWATSTIRDGGQELSRGLIVDPRRHEATADLVAELAVVDRQHPTFPDLRHADAVLMIVSSGVATAEDLARVAVAAYEVGGRFRGAVVADPDTLDRTTGRLLQAERVVAPPMPMKLTGVDTEEWRERDGGRS